MNKLTAFLFPGLILLAACDNQPMEDEQAPVIQWVAPSADAVVSSRDSIEIGLTFSENTELHETSVWVWETASEQLITSFRQHTHATELDVREKFFYPVSQETTLTIEAYASDHNGNEVTDIRTIRLLP